MSSQMTVTEQRKKATDMTVRQRPPARLIRSASLERIRKFNTYICSQNYFILPAILAWLRTSQSILKCNLKKCIVSIKSQSNALYRSAISLTIAVVDQIRANTFNAVVYLTITAIFSQLFVCLYVLSWALLPAELTFMATCLYVITHINLLCLRSIHRKHVLETTHELKPRLSRRNILCNRTLSNFNLF